MALLFLIGLFFLTPAIFAPDVTSIMRGSTDTGYGQNDNVASRLLLTRYLDVRNIRTVARELNLSRTTVASILTEHGIDTSRGMTDAQVSVAVELYEQGLSSATIGKHLGFDNHTILQEVRGRGVAIRLAAGSKRESCTERNPETTAIRAPDTD